MNSEVEMGLLWVKDCVLIEPRNNITGVSLVITSTMLFIPEVTLSLNDNIKLLGNIKQGYKRTVSWNKHKTTQRKNNILGHMIDPRLRNINRFFCFFIQNHSKMGKMILREIILLSITCH